MIDNFRMRFAFTRSMSALLISGAVLSTFAAAAVTPEQRKELAAISREVGEAAKLIRRKKLDEAEQGLQAAERRLEELIAAGVSESEPIVAGIQRNISLRQRALAIQRGEKPEDLGVSFSDDVAPIIEENCLGCHGSNNPRGGLRLDTFTGWEEGGASRLPLGRVLLPRLMANPPQRMPKGEDPLAPNEIQTIARWMREGAKFDGKSKDAAIGEKKGEDSEEEAALMIAKPTGNETVSFVNDVAPFMVNICGQCHMGDNPRGEFNITTFEGVMKGGESGQVIEPGSPDGSRLWLLVSNKEQPRMPPGQLRITAANYNALTTWIREGAKFDGSDPKKPLREIVPTVDAMRAKELAKLSPEQFVEHRREKSEAAWKKAFPKEQSTPVETEQFLVYGNVESDRLTQIGGWADELALLLRSTFGAQETPLWKGKLAIFVAQDRFGYEEFALAVNDRAQVPKEVHGHTVLAPDFDEAYIVLEDIGDEPSATSPGFKAQLANYLTQAFLERRSSNLPDWVVQGSGLHVAAGIDENNPYFPALRSRVDDALKSLTRPERIFEDGTFPPGDVATVGYALVEYLIQVGGAQKFSQFLMRIGQSGNVNASVQAVYGTTPAALAMAFAQSVAARRGP